MAAPTVEWRFILRPKVRAAAFCMRLFRNADASMNLPVLVAVVTAAMPWVTPMSSSVTYERPATWFSCHAVSQDFICYEEKVGCQYGKMYTLVVQC